jgi:nucleoside-diphosphate-sugar epimerase
MSTLLSLGHGYSARALAGRLVPQGWRVIGTTRNPAKAEAFRSEGVEPLLWPGDLAPALAEATHILCSAAPDAKGDPFLRAVPGIAQAGAVWVGYLSTTGVYGDHDGGWVDEATPLTPQSDRGRQRVLAEDQWRATGLPLHVFRLAGIYGPGRGPFEKCATAPPGGSSSRGRCSAASMSMTSRRCWKPRSASPTPGAAYNVCDDNPCPPDEVIGYAARLLGLPEPPAVPFAEVEPTMTPMARGFYNESKKVRNDRIKDELGVKLLFRRSGSRGSPAAPAARTSAAVPAFRR